jgi:bifunctional UDP-N-acetylglucosamine pyrophosphorylase/glucosamine-1-phosphate N-acetyltransferase
MPPQLPFSVRGFVGVQTDLNPLIASVVILAAGQGTRMKSELPKVLHPVCGRPMLLHVLDAVGQLCAPRVVVVLGYGYEQVLPHLPPECLVAFQERQLGTGHALLAAAPQLIPGPAVVLPGDTPLVTGETLLSLVGDYGASGASATVLTALLEDPSGYGRVIRDSDGSVSRIVEHRDATHEELAVREINSGMYVLPVPLALEILERVGADNDQGEIYLTDVIAGLRERGERVSASIVADPSLVMGVNSREELAEAETVMGGRSGLGGASDPG